MKKFIALILTLMTALSLVSAAFADAPNNTTINYNNVGEIISKQAGLYVSKNTSSERLRYVQNGTEFYLLDRQENWYYCAVPNDAGSYDYGWISGYYLIENPRHIILRDNSGVFAYAAPYNTDKRVGTVSDYQRFTVIATSGNYYIVSFRDAVCYLPMSADYWIEEDIEQIVNGPSTTYVVNADKTRVFPYSNTRHDYVDTYKTGKEVEVLYFEGNYAAIRYETVIGFIDMSRLNLK